MKRPVFVLVALLSCLFVVSARSDEAGDGTGGDDRTGRCHVCECGPLWTVQASALFTDRKSPNDQVLISDWATGATLLNANQFDFDWETGLEMSTMYHRRLGAAFEFRYMWLGDHSDTVAYTLPAATGITIHTNPVTYFGANTESTATFTSELHSFELNDRRTNCAWTLLYGVRYVHIADESLSAFLAFPGGGEAGRWDADNDLLGFQIGAERSLCFRNLLLTAGGKAGIYYADMETSFELYRGPDRLVDVFAAADDAGVGFLGELAFTASYPLTCNLSLTAGYHLLWLEGVAVGTEQVATTGSFNAVGPIGSSVDSGGMFYHGASAGLEYTY